MLEARESRLQICFALCQGLTYFSKSSRELLMSQSPSIIRNDRLDRDSYLVLEDFRSGAAFRETDEGITYIRSSTTF